MVPLPYGQVRPAGDTHIFCLGRDSGGSYFFSKL